MTDKLLPFCKCGCGERVSKIGNRFIQGHNKGNLGCIGKVSPRKIDRIIVICKNCGDEISTLPSSKRVFCNHKCKGEWMHKQKGNRSPNWQGGKETFICDWCGKDIITWSSQVADHNFCCRDCDAKWRSVNMCGENSPTWQGGKIEISCDRCGKKIMRYELKLHDHNFCCSECKSIWLGEYQRGSNHPMWQGGISNQKYCHKFNTRLKIKIRDKYDNCDYISGIH